MSSGLLLLVLASAFIHAGWNFTARKVLGNLPVYWLGLCLAGLVGGPFACLAATGAALREGLPFMLATGVINALYFAVLAKAYETGEIALVYPIARGFGLACTVGLAAAFLGERLSAAGAAGLAAVGTGIVLLGARARPATWSPRGSSRSSSAPRSACSSWARR